MKLSWKLTSKMRPLSNQLICSSQMKKMMQMLIKGDLNLHLKARWCFCIVRKIVSKILQCRAVSGKWRTWARCNLQSLNSPLLNSKQSDSRQQSCEILSSNCMKAMKISLQRCEQKWMSLYKSKRFFSKSDRTHLQTSIDLIKWEMKLRGWLSLTWTRFSHRNCKYRKLRTIILRCAHSSLVKSTLFSSRNGLFLPILMSLQKRWAI